MSHGMLKLIWIYVGIIFGLAILNQILFGSKKKRKTNRIKRPTQYNPTNKAIRKLNTYEIMDANIESLSGTDFEKLIAMYYRDKGYSVEIVGGSGDNEVDLIMKGKEGYKIAVQCKRWKGNVGNDIVLRLKAGKQFHGCYDAWIITTSFFTKDAQKAAEKLNITLINGAQTHHMIETWKKKKIL